MGGGVREPGVIRCNLGLGLGCGHLYDFLHHGGAGWTLWLFFGAEMTTDQLAAAATQRLAEFINRSAAQHLRRMREAWAAKVAPTALALAP